VLYGVGGAVYAVKEAAYTMFVLLFYTQVLGLSGVITGVIIALSLLWDGISDPLVGTLSDRLRSRWGRRHPYMLCSILPMGIGFIGLFSPPHAITTHSGWLATWLLFWSLWVRTFITTFSIPHLALSAELSSDYHERSQVLGARLGFLFLFSVLVPASAMLLIFGTADDGTDGRFAAHNYPLYGALSCALCWVLGAVSTIGTRDAIRSSIGAQRQASERTTLAALLRDMRRTLHNASFRLVLGFEISNMIAYGTVSTLNVLMWTYYWGFTAREISLLLALPALLAVPLVLASLGPLGRRFEKYQLMQLSMLGLIINCLWLYPARMLGLLPPGAANLSFALNLLFVLCFIYFFLLRAVQTQSIIADISDEHTFNHAQRQEGGLFSAANLANKFATVFGPAYGGVVLELAGLEENMRPGAVPPDVMERLAWAFAIGTVPGFVLALWFALRINLSRARVEAVQLALRQRGHDGGRPPA